MNMPATHCQFLICSPLTQTAELPRVFDTPTRAGILVNCNFFS